MHFTQCSLVAALASVLATSTTNALAPSSSFGNKARPITKKRTNVFSPKAIAIPLDQQQDVDVDVDYETTPLADADAWVSKLDYEGFGKEVTALGKKLIKEGGDEDVEHLNKLVSWRNTAAAIGVASMWAPPNPVTILALSTWTYASWAMIAHHTCHGGYNRVDAGKFNSRGFAIGSTIQRGKDWLDWMLPEAWNVEHNRLHHYRLNEAGDPDLVQRNVESFLGDRQVPMAARYGIVVFFVAFWKWAYYAPNTFKELKLAAWVKEGKPIPEGFKPEQPVTALSFLYARDPSEKALPQIVDPKEFFTKVVAPFFLTRFVLLPAPLLAIPGIGPTLFGHAIVNLIGAELLTNVHSFLTIVTNHCGDDMYTFDDAVKPKTPSFYVRQVVGSVNYDCGTDVIDFSHGFLNYQIEHHGTFCVVFVAAIFVRIDFSRHASFIYPLPTVWPDLSMLAYQKAAPQLKAICEKYGVPYVQESVFTRLRKTVDIMVGKTTMRTFPTQYEPSKDKAVNGVSWKSTNGAIDE